jgi:hypothetical protein
MTLNIAYTWIVGLSDAAQAYKISN